MLDNKFFAERPADIGVDEEKMEVLFNRVAQEVNEGLLPASQAAICRNGKIAGFRTFGDADDNSLFHIFSCTKALTSAAAWLLIEAGKLDAQEKVADIIPEFADNGKQDITVEQLFTHTAGFPHAPFRSLLWNDPKARVEKFASWRLNWEPGTRFEYHPTSSMWIIAEIIERRADQKFQNFVRERIVEPLGISDFWLSLPAEQNARVADVTFCGDPLTAEDYAKMGMSEPPETEVTEDALIQFNKPEIRDVPIPGGGGITNAASLALFYQGLLHTRSTPIDGPQIWQEDTLNMAKEIRSGELTDMMFGKLANRALGLIISGDEDRNFRGFGHTNSPEAFGHAGAGGQIAWADPATGLSFAYVTNGHDRNNVRQARRGISISNHAAVCAG